MAQEDNASYVLMLKNPDTGFLERELGQYKLEADTDLIEGLCAEQTEEGVAALLRLGVGHMWDDIGDELYDRIYDAYDADLLPDFVSEIAEVDGSFNPVWEARFLFSDNPAEMEDRIKRVLSGHRKALSLLL